MPCNSSSSSSVQTLMLAVSASISVLFAV